jgi:low affinity Fe/Cu permease
MQQKEFDMTTLTHHNTAAKGATQPVKDNTKHADSDRALSALLLAAAVAALAVTLDQLIGTWADEHLLTAWVALWAVVFAGSLLLAGTAHRMAGRVRSGLDAWARRRAEARAEERFVALAQRDPRLLADISVAVDNAAAKNDRVNLAKALRRAQQKTERKFWESNHYI